MELPELEGEALRDYERRQACPECHNESRGQGECERCDDLYASEPQMRPHAHDCYDFFVN
jgi:hypothetical protein